MIKVRAAQPGLSKELITNADGLDEDAKLDAVVDIETLNTQLAKTILIHPSSIGSGRAARG